MNAHGQDVPHVEERADHSNFTDYSCVGRLTRHDQVKSNLPPENILNAHGEDVPHVEERADHLNWQIILFCWNVKHA